MGAALPLHSISEVAAFLEINSPTLSEQLKSRGPDYASALESGVSLGLADDVDAGGVSTGLRIRAEVLAVALEPMVLSALKKIENIDAKLRTLAMLKFLSGVTGALAAPGTILSLLFQQQAAAIILSALSFFGSMVQLFADNLVLGLGTKESDLIERSRTMSSTIAYGQLASKTLSALLAANAEASEISEMTKEANNRFGILNDALSKRP